MNVPLLTALGLIAAHFVGDFVLQSNWMATNKSHRWLALAVHVAVYSACLLPFGLAFAGVNAVAHFCVDAVTSRINSRLWAAKRVHAFFVGVGADQGVHMATLMLTAWWLS